MVLKKKIITISSLFFKLKKAIGDAETIKITPDSEQSYGSLSRELCLKNGQIKETAITEQTVNKENGSTSDDSKIPNGPMVRNF